MPARLAGAVSLLGLVVLLAPAAEGPGKPPVCRFGLVLKYRKAGEDSFRASRRYSLECYQEATGAGVYLSQTGALAVVPPGLFKAGEGREKAPLSQHGFELAVAGAGGEKVAFGVECYLDDNTGNLLYLTQTGAVAVVPARYATPTRGKPKGCVRLYALRLKVRPAGDEGRRDTRQYAVEVFQDQNNDNLVYLSETGSIAVVPRALVNREATTDRAARLQSGLELAARRAGRRKFDKRHGIEVYRDENNGCLVYISDTGSLAVVGSRLVRAVEGKPRAPVLKHGLTLAVRKSDEKAFSDTTMKFGVEVYADEDGKRLLYLGETGSLAVVAENRE
jgi:hypothetical protein